MVTFIKKLFNFTGFFDPLLNIISRWFRQSWLDILIIAIFASAAAIATYHGSQQINPLIFGEGGYVWFDADIPRVFENMTNRDSDHHSTKVHLLFLLIAFPPAFLITKIFNIEPMMAVRVTNAVVAFLWIATFFALFRLIGCCSLDAILFSGLATASASVIFWFVVPETFLLGSLSIMFALCFAVLTEFRQFSSLWYICISAFTLCFTVTNWMAGVMITFVTSPKNKHC